jgi:hypothetical protein
MLAQARIAAVSAGDDAGDEIIEGFIAAYDCARRLGRHDAEMHVFQPPMMFAGEVDLLNWWKDGHDSFAEPLTVAGCAGSDDGSDEPGLG